MFYFLSHREDLVSSVATPLQLSGRICQAIIIEVLSEEKRMVEQVYSDCWDIIAW